MAREIVLDTETTGLDPRSGHRLVEIACIEIEDLLPTGRFFHRYCDPERDCDPEAEKVHGLTKAFLKGKPRFETLADEFLEFVDGATLVAHNAAFDRGFVNAELERAGRAPIPDPRWTCTYILASKKFPGMYNSLDALCKRFKISLAEREKHGALIDTKLLASVYLELHGGKERGLDLAPQAVARTAAAQAVTAGGYGPRPRPLSPRGSEEERDAHASFVAKVLKDKAIWATLEG